MRCDIFCTVIDHFGDIGVSWRLARQLSDEYGWRVRLWADDLTTFARLCAEIDARAPQQQIGNVIVEHWRTDIDWSRRRIEAADVVIETFACHPPLAYIAALARRAQCAPPRRAPVWINLEYLNNEDWVIGCHLKPSPHPRYPLTKYFFCPSLIAGAGGALKERGLDETRRAFLANAHARTALWTALGLPIPTSDATVVSLFSYENAALKPLLAAWRAAAAPVVCIVPEGIGSNAVARCLRLPSPAAGSIAAFENLTLCIAPFVHHEIYDRLLWNCDLNFVRGEDSFVRAQWAHRPLVWQLYPQNSDAHFAKLDATLATYAADLPTAARVALTHFWRVWNGAVPASALDWNGFWQHRGIYAVHARRWAHQLNVLGSLAAHLVEFCESVHCGYGPAARNTLS